jgi:hypothetical protein
MLSIFYYDGRKSGVTETLAGAMGLTGKSLRAQRSLTDRRLLLVTHRLSIYSLTAIEFSAPETGIGERQSD